MVQSLLVDSWEARMAPGSLEDAELARRIGAASPGQARDEEEELFRRLAPRVRLYGLRHLRDEQSAADLTQQVLLVLLEGLRAGRVRKPEKLASFVLGTCRLVVLEQRRSAGRRRQLLAQFERDLSATSFSMPALELNRLTECMERLGERERSVLVMTFYDERTGEETAQFLGLSPENVRVIRHRALGRLRQCMSPEGGPA
jgi:RNA polymerase sigma-70 factor (ECF subfamily)